MEEYQRMTQHPLPSPFSKVKSAARVAASNTSSTPSPVKEEHSKYFRAPISWAISLASRLPTKFIDFLRISSTATGSSRKSFFSPTSRIGTPGHRSLASSTHYVSLATFVSNVLTCTHLVFHVVQRIGSVERKSNEDYMCLRICQRSQSLVVFLSCRIPQC